MNWTPDEVEALRNLQPEKSTEEKLLDARVWLSLSLTLNAALLTAILYLLR